MKMEQVTEDTEGPEKDKTVTNMFFSGGTGAIIR